MFSSAASPVSAAAPAPSRLGMRVMAIDTRSSEDACSALSSPLSSVPSSPLSSPESSPEPPPFMLHSKRVAGGNVYPSPPASQQTSQSSSPTPDGMESSVTTDVDGPPPAKRRRISKGPKARTTQFIDLRGGTLDADEQVQFDRVLRVLHNHQKIVVIAGAGMSVAAGIPDFRSSTGVFKSLKKEHKLKGSGKDLFDASVYKDDTSTTSFHSMVSSMSLLVKDAKPTDFHHMLATMAKDDRLLRLYSQNVDGIDTALDPLKTCVPLRKDQYGKWPRTVQLHGGLDKMVCSKCQELSDFDPSLFSGPVPPGCSRCEEINDIRTTHQGKRSHGIGRLRPRMVLYNEHNPDDEAIGAVTREDLRKRPDAVVVVGTTLKVPGVRRIVREMCGTVRDRRGGVAIWINNDLPPVARDLEDCFDIIVQSDCDEVAQRAAMRKWNEKPPAPDDCTVSEEISRRAERTTVKVVPKCLLASLAQDTLPSSRHINNSFVPPPPYATPKKAVDTSPDFSPMTSRRGSIMPSIETDSASDENIVVASPLFTGVIETGLLTPSKSRRSTPALKFPTINETLKDGAKTKKATAKSRAKGASTSKTKKPIVRTAKPQASKAKTTGLKPQSCKNPGGFLTGVFKTSKALFTETKAASKPPPPSPAKCPSKLRQVSNASEVMNSLPPQDARKKTSPSKPVAYFPGLVDGS